MSDDAPEALPAGTVLDKYAIVRAIGSGGMGAIYEATHTDLGKRVALKTLHPELARNAEARARFLREGRAATRLRHPHVVDVNDVGVSNGVPYLVMEFLDGETLAAVLEREGALAIDRIAEIMLPVLSAVATAHDEQIVHRDLKPENIFLARARHGTMLPKLLDFGISKVAEPTASGLALTGTNALLGTPFYMSPEQASGAKNVDARSDQYALGVILYECATGVRPFRAETLFTLLTAIVNGSFEPPHAVRADVPPGFEAAVMRAMRRDASERHESVSALARDLLPFASAPVHAAWAGAFASTDAKSAPPANPPHVSGTATAPPVSRSVNTPATPSMLGGTTLSASATEQPAVVTPKPARRLAAAATVVVALALAGAVAWTLHARDAVRPGRSVEAAHIAIAAPTGTPPPTGTVEPSAPPIPPIATAPTPSPAVVAPIVAVDAGSTHAHHGASTHDRAHMGVNNSPVFE